MQSQSEGAGARRRVLVVEDDQRIRELVLMHAGLEGLEAVGVADGERAMTLARAEAFDLIVLDLMLPGIDGLTVCRAVRRETPNRDVPILMLTARDEESDKVLGLESGADDYLTKPFGIRELVARMRALLRRPRLPRPDPGVPADAASRSVEIAGLRIDPARRQVRVDGRAVELTVLEFDLLYLLASNPGIVFSREALIARVWGGDTYVTERNVDTIVKRLRRKVEADPSDPKYLLTVWGSGYKFAER
ncbi:MAG TPA: response regulator transcription factor [Vicinamibacterales bacterium]|nr:response regulator transcription factor [Vicinamibacterales bacterium]